MTQKQRAVALSGLTLFVLVAIGLAMGAAYATRMVLESACMAMIALGLTIQWGYAGLFNAGIVGFVAVAAFSSLVVSFPVNSEFWATGGPALLVPSVLVLVGATVVLIIVRRWKSISEPVRAALSAVIALTALLAAQSAADPVIAELEADRQWIGGLGLPVWLGWVSGGATAAAIGWVIGRITLGLRADYLAIATLGIAEILTAVLKNADWLTRGTVTVSPLPWPVPPPDQLGFVASRGLFAAIAIAAVIVTYLMLERAWAAPWGRMMRAIRDNETAAAAMGKDVNRRRLEIFILGNILIGIGGAMLVTSTSIFDPTSFSPLNHTFLIWVMVILGGPGNNLGTIIGAVLVYSIWTMSEPITLWLFQAAAGLADSSFGWEAPSDLHTRALQMRVFLIGLVIVVVLRLTPNGLLPEKIARYD